MKSPFTSILRHSLFGSLLAMSGLVCCADDVARVPDDLRASLFEEKKQDAVSFTHSKDILAQKGMYEIKAGGDSKINIYGSVLYFSIGAGCLLLVVIGLNLPKHERGKSVRRRRSRNGEFSVSLRRVRSTTPRENAPRKIIDPSARQRSN